MAGGGLGGQHPGGRSRFQHVDGTAGRLLFRGQSPGGLHDQQGRTDVQVFQSRPHGRQVAAHDRPHVGVDHGGGGALVFLAFAKHLRGEGDLNLGQLPAQKFSHQVFVLGPGVGVQQAHGYRFDLLFLQAAGDAVQVVGVHLGQNLAPGRQALPQLESQEALHQLRRFLEKEVIHLGGPDAAQFQHVPEPPGGDQGRQRPAPLQDGVGGHGGSVNHFGHLRPGSLGVAEQLRDPVEHGGFEAGGRGGNLGGPDVSRGIGQNHVGEGAPDVGPQPDRPLRFHAGLP